MNPSTSVNHIRKALEMMIDKSYDDSEKEKLIDEFGTLNPYIALLTVWASKSIPDEELFKLIEELHINPEDLPARLRDAYTLWKFKVTVCKSKPVSSKIVEISKLAKDNQSLFSLDITPEKLPKRITKRSIPKRLPTILTLGTQDTLAQLEKLTNKDYEVYKWVDWFPEAVKYLKILYKCADTGDEGLLAKIPDDAYTKLKKMFPNTMKRLYKELESRKPLTGKSEPSKLPIFLGIVIPRPKKRRYTWMGMEIGVENLGMDLEVYGEIIKRQYRKRLSKYPPDIVEKAIEYVKRKFPHLDENSASFWETVESYVIDYVNFGRFLDI